MGVQVEEGDGAEGGGDAAGARHSSVDRVDQGLHHGMAGRVHVVGQRKAALPQAEKGVVATGSNNPPVPSDIVKIYIKVMASAPVAGEPL